MLKNIRAYIQKQTKPKYKDEKYMRVQTPIDGLNHPLQP